MKEWLSIRILVAVPSALSPKPQIPDSPHMILVLFILPLTESIVSGYEWNFVHWPFKRMPGSQVDSHLSLMDRIPTDFHSQMLCSCLFLALMLWDREPRLGLRPHSSQGVPHPHSWDIPPEPQLLHMGVGPALFTSPSFLPVQCGFCKSLLIRLLFS